MTITKQAQPGGTCKVQEGAEEVRACGNQSATCDVGCEAGAYTRSHFSST